MVTINEKSSTGLDANLAGALAYLLGFLTGILFLIIEKDSAFVRFHAMQSTMTFLGIFVVSIVLNFVPFLGLLVSLLLTPLILILWLFLMYKAFQGERFKLPGVGDMAEQQLR